MSRTAKEGDGTLEGGTPRMRILITTKENDFAECTFERLNDRIELEPVDMARTRRAMKAAYRTYKRVRGEEVEAMQEKPEEVPAGDGNEGSTEVLPTTPETKPGDVEDEQGGEDD